VPPEGSQERPVALAATIDTCLPHLKLNQKLNTHRRYRSVLGTLTITLLPTNISMDYPAVTSLNTEIFARLASRPRYPQQGRVCLRAVAQGSHSSPAALPVKGFCRKAGSQHRGMRYRKLGKHPFGKSRRTGERVLRYLAGGRTWFGHLRHERQEVKTMAVKNSSRTERDLIGENAAESEITLNYIVESFSREYVDEENA
jgi:hypothetical protein